MAKTKDITAEYLLELMDKAFKGDVEAFREAEFWINEGLNQQPDSVDLLNWLGAIYTKSNRHGQAIALYRRAIELCGTVQSAQLWCNIGNAYRQEHNKSKALSCLQRAVELDPGVDHVWNNIGTQHINEGEPDKALEALEKGLILNPSHPFLHWNRGIALLEKGEFGEGFDEYAWGMVTGDRMVKYYGFAPWWNGEKVGTLVVYDEQGIGDSVMYHSMIPDAAKHCDNLIIDCHPRLVNLLKRSFPYAQVHGTRKESFVSDWVKDVPQIDAKIAIGTIPRFFRRKNEDFPKKAYLVADPKLVEKYKAEIIALQQANGTGAPIIMAYAGGVKSTRKDQRQIPLDNWQPIFDAFPNHTYISCDYMDRKDEYAALKEKTGITVHLRQEVFCSKLFQKYKVVDQAGNTLRECPEKEEAKMIAAAVQGATVVHEPGQGYDLDDFFAYLVAVDQLGGICVTVNNSNVHFSGALGTRCITLTPTKCAWRYGLGRKDVPWYGPWVTQCRQHGDDWAPAFAEAVGEMQEHFSKQEESAG